MAGVLNAEVAGQWARSVVPSWIYRYLMPAGWLAAMVVSLMGSEEVPCSPSDPTICGPDRTFSLAMILCVGSLVLWWWQPRLAAAAGLLFLVLELRYDEVPQAKAAWAVYAAGCAAILLWLILSRRRQQALTAGLATRPVMVPAAETVGITFRLGAAVALVIIGVAALGVMRWQDQREETHLDRAVEQTAVVKGYTDGDLEIELPDGSRRTVSVLDGYENGANIPVLIDPADGEWIRLRAEPADYTFWYTVAGGVWTLALLLVLRDSQLRRARPRRAWAANALPVRIAPDASSLFAVRSTDDSVLVGFLSLDLDDEDSDSRLFAAFDLLDEEEVGEAPAALRREWAETLRQYQGEVLLAGDLTEGSWPTILVGDHVLRPAAPLRAPRRTPWSTESVEGLPPDLAQLEGPSTVSSADHGRRAVVEPAGELPELPWSVPVEAAPWWNRPALAGLLIAGPGVAALLSAAWGEWMLAIALTASGMGWLHQLSQDIFYRVTVSADEVRTRTGTFEQVQSWPTVDFVDAGKDRVSLRVGEDWFVIAGLLPGQAPHVASVFEALRLRATDGRMHPAVARRRITPQFAIETLYVLSCAGVLALLRWGPF